MSHAGQYLELLVLGRWWADIPTYEWPAGLQSEIEVDFDSQVVIACLLVLLLSVCCTTSLTLYSLNNVVLLYVSVVDIQSRCLRFWQRNLIIYYL
jgi:hypothetical protein